MSLAEPTLRPARQAAGSAGGALSGRYPDPSLGLVPAAGISLWDDFIFAGQSGVAGLYGQLLWARTDYGAAATITYPVSTAATDIGLLRATTPAVANQGSALAWDPSISSGWNASPPVGTIWAAKVRISGTTNRFRAWSGLWSSTTEPLTANNTGFIGVRAVDTGGATPHWYGVVKDGAGAGNEDTLDLGQQANGTYLIFGWERVSAGFQFFRLDMSNPLVRYRINVGTIGTGNAPAAPLTGCALGVVADSGAARSTEIDFWAIGGAIPR